MNRVYLDHAATSWPKPVGVVDAFVNYQLQNGSSSGRGAYGSSQAANKIVANVRSLLAKLLNAGSSNDIVFTSNGTASLNLAFAGILKPGDHVITTAAEHNSVLRPLRHLQNKRSIDLTIVGVDSIGQVSPKAIQQAIQVNTRLVAVTHASNVTGCLQPLEAISEVCSKSRVRLLVDAAQTLGYIPIDVQKLKIDLLAAPGHKGACGLLGTGLLYANPATAEAMEVVWPGGTGTDSTNLDGPFSWPEGFEAGNLNLPSLAGWEAGLKWLSSESLDSRRIQSNQLRDRLSAILQNSNLGRLLGNPESSKSVPVVSLVCSTSNCAELSALLDSAFRIETRSGLHCAGAIHKYLGTDSTGGTLRFSLGHTTTNLDLDALETACRELKRSGI
jgi:cysteine desulfurase / selenocysteine lyase